MVCDFIEGRKEWDKYLHGSDLNNFTKWGRRWTLIGCSTDFSGGGTGGGLRAATWRLRWWGGQQGWPFHFREKERGPARLSSRDSFEALLPWEVELSLSCQDSVDEEANPLFTLDRDRLDFESTTSTRAIQKLFTTKVPPTANVGGE